MSAWTLCYNRRYRAGRNADAELGLDSSSPDRDPDLRRPRHCHGHGHGHGHGGRHRQHSEDRAHRTERETILSDHSTIDPGAGNASNGGAESSGASRLRLVRNDQLPGAVLLARARLLERLRASSLTGSRQAPTVSGSAWDEFIASDEFNFSDSGDGEVESRQWFESAVPYVESVVQTDEAPSFHDVSWKKTSGFNWEAFCSLQHEVFNNIEETDGIKRELLECCICLERFFEGEVLIRLHCAHRFHPACLEPWVQTNSNCPYCRASIIC